METMGLSIRAYARHRGVSHVAVLRAAKAGRIPVEPDGTIDPAKADAAWQRSTDPARGKRKQEAPATKLKPVPEAALGSVRETLKEQGLPASGSQRRIRSTSGSASVRQRQNAVAVMVWPAAASNRAPRGRAIMVSASKNTVRR